MYDENGNMNGDSTPTPTTPPVAINGGVPVVNSGGHSEGSGSTPSTPPNGSIPTTGGGGGGSGSLTSMTTSGTGSGVTPTATINGGGSNGSNGPGRPAQYNHHQHYQGQRSSTFSPVSPIDLTQSFALYNLQNGHHHQANSGFMPQPQLQPSPLGMQPQQPHHHQPQSNGGGSGGGTGALNQQLNRMALISHVMNVKDPTWLQVEVCREYQRGQCSRNEQECKFAHPLPHVEVQNGRVIACYDSLKNRCTRGTTTCKFLHPPQHLKEQVLNNGRNNFALKNYLMAQMTNTQAYTTTLAPNFSQLGFAQTVPTSVGTPMMPAFNPYCATAMYPNVMIAQSADAYGTINGAAPQPPQSGMTQLGIDQSAHHHQKSMINGMRMNGLDLGGQAASTKRAVLEKGGAPVYHQQPVTQNSFNAASAAAAAAAAMQQCQPFVSYPPFPPSYVPALAFTGPPAIPRLQ